jgi:hypothetical protein
MSKHQFEELCWALRWSNQHDTPDDGDSLEQHQWNLVDEFVRNFNEHRSNYFKPSELICVDESMSLLYGQGGHWINHGLAQYVAIDCKPENGQSGVMLSLKLVKGTDLPGAKVEEYAPNGENSLLHGTNVLKHVVSPWFGSNRVVCADSCFASVGGTKELFRNAGLKCFGVVKTANQGFPKTFLVSIELNSRGCDFLLALKTLPQNDEPIRAAFVWKDSKRCYFISTAGSCKKEQLMFELDGGR